MRDGSRRIFMTTWRVVQGRKRKFSRFLYLRNNFFRGCLLVFVVMHWEMSKTTKTPQSLSRHTATISTIDSSNFPWIFFPISIIHSFRVSITKYSYRYFPSHNTYFFFQPSQPSQLWIQLRARKLSCESMNVML